MSESFTEINVFLSCPDEIITKTNFKDIVENELKAVNTYYKDTFGVCFDLKHWKKNPILGRGVPRVQDVINQYLIKNCDIYIGILWKSFGNPPGKNANGIEYSSGTEEEYYFAKDLNLELWFFFYNPRADLDIDSEGIAKIKKFKDQLKKDQIWYCDFYSNDELKEVLKESINGYINKKYSVIPKKITQTEAKKEDFRKLNRGF